MVKETATCTLYGESEPREPQLVIIAVLLAICRDWKLNPSRLICKETFQVSKPESLCHYTVAAKLFYETENVLVQYTAKYDILKDLK